MESLVMERVRLKASTAPRRASDPAKPDLKLTYRFAFKLLVNFLKLNPFPDP